VGGHIFLTVSRLQISRRGGFPTLLLVLAALLCAAAAALPGVASAAGAPRATAKQHKPKPLYWGAWIGDQITGTTPPWDMTPVNDLAGLLGKGISLVEFSSPFTSCASSPCAFYRFPAAGMTSIRDYGAIPFFSWGAESSPRTSAVDPEFQLSDLIQGRYDSYIRQFAEEARDWGHPFFLRFDWEMNGTWFPWSEGVNGNQPGEYVAAWRHVHDIFSEVGATNATWVWCPYADPQAKLNSKLRQMYPGNAYVDWTCLDGYNWGHNPVNAKPWRSFSQIFATTYEKIAGKIAPKKPMLLGEFASSPNGGHKAAWIRNMLSVIPKKFPRIRGLIYLDGYDRGINWPLETSGSVASAFAHGIARPIFRANEYGALSSSPIPPP